nr:polysaccharide pyruvyl transferase family protein [Microbacterium yannicii]
MSPEDNEHLQALRTTTLSVLERVLAGATDIALIDAPNQRNVGDSLIWAGEIAYFQKLGLRIRYICDLWSYDPAGLRRAMPEGVVLFHGGGNFGDLWPGHQILREKVARDLTDYRVVQLPQSIYFADDARAAEANAILGGHPDFHVLIRDSLSITRAAEQLPDVTISFCPDMALGWTAPASTSDAAAASDRVVVIARADKEASSGLDTVDAAWLPGRETHVTDWAELSAVSRRWRFYRNLSLCTRFYAKVRKRIRFLPVRLPNRFAQWVITGINDVNVSNAVHLYDGSRAVVTDRLHAHILAVLMGIPHVVLDNNYQKVSQIMRDYSGGFSTVGYADDLTEARSLAMAVKV